MTDAKAFQHQSRAPKVHPKDGIDRRLDRRHARSVGEDVHPTEVRGHFGQCGHRFRVRDVGHLLDHLVTLTSQLLCRRAQRPFIDVGQHERGARAESAGDGHAHSPNAGHDDDRPLRLHRIVVAFTHGSLSLRWAVGV